MKISAVYKIKNNITGDFYIGSSKNVKKRWANHKCPAKWRERPNSPLYQDMQRYGVDKFDFTYLCFVEPKYLKQVEQEMIDFLHPTYNKFRAYLTKEQRHKYNKYNSIYAKKHYQKHKDSIRGKSRDYCSKHREHYLEHIQAYYRQPCLYNGEEKTLRALICMFRKLGYEKPTQEAKKYLIKK